MSPEPTDLLDRDQRLSAVLVACLEAMDNGQSIDRQELLARYPDFADELVRFLDDQGQVDQFAAPLRAVVQGVAATPPGDERQPGNASLVQIGDFRIVREVGRGGMGVVYEAEQLSLGRRVALKVLPYAATMDPRQLQRFQNEARAAASLHHEHIVPVHAVGSEGAIHFYAMQFIDGRTLAEVIAGSRRTDGVAAEPTKVYTPSATPATDTEPTATRTTSPPCDEAYFRRAAEWGVQAAEALEHAHSLGVVHRDVKPANLMIDPHDKLWVTDFGLARLGADTALTMTGDLIGTLRYMSPEQALAKHGLVDHRTDVYALGATLYELLTLRPAVDGKDRAEILRRVAFEEPTPPRALNHSLPADLETITLKAMAKEPTERYASAKELADDLGRFLEHHPIQARRPSVGQRLRKWGRRHRAVVTAATAGLLLAVVGLAAGAAWAWSEKVKAEAAAETAMREKEQKEQEQVRANANAREAQNQRLRAEDNLRKAIRAWGDSFRFFSQRPAEKDTPELAAARKELSKQARSVMTELAKEVDGDPSRRPEAALAHAGLAGVWVATQDYAAAEQEFAKAATLYKGLVAEFPDEPRYAEGRDALYRDILILAHHRSTILGPGRDWEFGPDGPSFEMHLSAARLYDLVPVDWTPPTKDGRSVSSLFHAADVFDNAARHLVGARRPAEAERLLDRAVERYRTTLARFGPEQIWVAYCVQQQGRSLLLRGRLRAEAGRWPEAEEDYRAAATLFASQTGEDAKMMWADLDLAEVEQARGELFWARGEKGAAVAAFGRVEAAWKAPRGRPEKMRTNDRACSLNDLAWFRATCADAQFRKPDEAVTLAEQAVKLNSKIRLLWRTLGAARLRAGQPGPAAEALEKGMELGRGGEALDWFLLAQARHALGEKEKARAWFDKAAAWIGKHRSRDPEQLRFRAEAAAALGITDEPAGTEARSPAP